MVTRKPQLSDPIIVIEDTSEIVDKCSPSNLVLPCDYVDIDVKRLSPRQSL